MADDDGTKAPGTVSAASATPPRAPITFRVGIVGHRPDRLPQDAAGLMALKDRLGFVLRAVADFVSSFSESPDAAFYQAGVPPALRANSPLAEGADRLFATEALALGYHLTCIMPFAQSEFERDFEAPHAIGPDPLDDFRTILARAKSSSGLTRIPARRPAKPSGGSLSGRGPGGVEPKRSSGGGLGRRRRARGRRHPGHAARGHRIPRSDAVDRLTRATWLEIAAGHRGS